MENEIMVTEEMTEMAVENTKINSGKAVAITAAAVGGLALLGGLAYKFIIKPRRDKRKAQQELNVVETDIDDLGELE